MVRLAGFSAINQDRQDERLAAQETLEAQEARIIDDYERALHQLSLGDAYASEVRVRTCSQTVLLIRIAQCF
jgi:hypothetical protein